MMHMRKVMKTIGICSMAAIMMAGLSGCGGKTGGAVSSGAECGKDRFHGGADGRCGRIWQVGRGGRAPRCRRNQ